MTNEQPMSQERFIKRRLSDLCLKSALSGFPKDELNQQVLLKSAVLMLDASTALTEKAINERLAVWVNDISHIEGIDFVTVRRAGRCGLPDSRQGRLKLSGGGRPTPRPVR